MESTFDKHLSLIKQARDLSEKDGDLISVLYKTSQALQSECQAKTKQIQDLQSKVQGAVQKSASDESAADKGTLDKSQLKAALQKLAAEDVMEEETIDQHVQKAVHDPTHLAKMLDVVADEYHTVKTASQPAEVPSVGRVRETSETSGSHRLIKAGFEQEAQEATETALEELDQQCGSMIDN